MTTFLLVLWFGVIAFNVWWDSDGHKPNYVVVNTLRVVAAIVHCYFFFPDPKVWQTFIPVFAFQLTSYFIFFPWWLNVVTEKNPAFLYIDRTEHDSGRTDRFFSNFKPWVLLAVKVVAFITMVASIVFIYAYH